MDRAAGVLAGLAGLPLPGGLAAWARPGWYRPWMALLGIPMAGLVALLTLAPFGD